MRSLPSDQCGFSVQAPFVPIDLPCFSDHPVTGDQVAYRIRGNGVGDSPVCLGNIQLLRDLLIRPDVADRDIKQGLPYIDLKIGTSHCQMDSVIAVDRSVEYLFCGHRGTRRIFNNICVGPTSKQRIYFLPLEISINKGKGAQTSRGLCAAWVRMGKDVYRNEFAGPCLAS